MPSASETSCPSAVIPQTQQASLLAPCETKVPWTCIRPPLPSANPTSDTKMFSSTMLKQFIHLYDQLAALVRRGPSAN
jgi:hypothetical protein